MLQSELKINAHELQLLGEAESLVFGGLDKLNASFPRRKPTVTARAFREDGHKFLRVIRWAWQHPLEYYTVITADYNKKVPDRGANSNGRRRGKKNGAIKSQSHRESVKQPMHTYADFAGLVLH